MHWINWLVVAAYIGYIVIDGLRRSKGTDELEGYFLAKRSLPWWVVGLSVMATQLSAITMVGTTGQGATDGMRFVQFYFGLPIAMLILSVTLVPFLYRAKVYTAYEYLERRFDARTRALTAFLFLMSRGMSAGVIISAPAVIFSAIFGMDLIWSVALIGVPTVLYTMIGGVQAVAWADVKQMVLIVFGLFAVVAALILGLPDGVGMGDALTIAGATGRLRTFDFRFDINETYTFWSGLIGGTFLMMSYFGTDQSQVQRHLTAKSVDAARSSLLMSAYWKIPLQALVLLVGVLVFAFFLFTRPPLLYNPAAESVVRAAEPAEYAALEQRYADTHERRREAAHAVAEARRQRALSNLPIALENFRTVEAELEIVRDNAIALATRVTGRDAADVNYIIPSFVLGHLPIGFAGLFIAAVLAAAMSSIAAELNALSTATVVDFYRRWIRAEGSDRHFLFVGKLATGFWGLFCCVVATRAVSLGSLIEVVNRFGSFFYGSILGVFLLAMIRRARGGGAFVGLIAGMSAVGAVNFLAPDVSFLWHNVIGALTVLAVGLGISLTPEPRP
ncbi:MAG: sodium:solute symporter [Gemmatimonadetes bacterium]|nr:sodium:solute symporter [Gemmatimonadota bacterium]